MAEEFQESDVMFDDKVDEDESSNESDSKSRNNQAATKIRKKLIKYNKKNSVPVNIPDNVSQSSSRRRMDSNFDCNNDGGEMVPPHVIIGRRVAGNVMAYSVCTGNGRTLKGRDLSQVRNSILRMTGFLET